MKKDSTVLTLPFVEDRKVPGKRGTQRCFWAVKPTGDYVKDCDLGSEYAISLINYTQAHNMTALLPWIQEDMQHESNDRGIRIGFFSMIMGAAAYGKTPYMDYRRRSMEAWVESQALLEEAHVRIRSEAARKGWATRRANRQKKAA